MGLNNHSSRPFVSFAPLATMLSIISMFNMPSDFEQSILVAIHTKITTSELLMASTCDNRKLKTSFL